MRAFDVLTAAGSALAFSLAVGLPAFTGQACATSSASGWKSLTPIPGSDIVQWQILSPDAKGKGKNATLTTYVNANYTRENIKRVIINVHGKGRDAFNYWNHTNVALSMAAQQTNNWVDPNAVLIIAPDFLNGQDKGAFPWNATAPKHQQAYTQTLIYKGNLWADGDVNEYPYTSRGVSSFQVYDEFIKQFSDPTQWPNVNTIVLAGHSMGGQFVQRYAMIGDAAMSPNTKASLRFIVANAGSYLYPDEKRPLDVSNCSDYNLYKYGFNNYSIIYGADKATDPQNLFQRYITRNMHYMYGLLDFGPGDLRCGAMVQGHYHLERGEYFMQFLNALPGGFPKNSTIDYVPNASHDDFEMFSSQYGLQRMFYDNYEGDGQIQESNAPAGVDNGINNGTANWYSGAGGAPTATLAPSTASKLAKNEAVSSSRAAASASSLAKHKKSKNGAVSGKTGAAVAAVVGLVGAGIAVVVA